MNRRLFLLSIAGAAGCSSGRKPRLNVYNWSDYVAPDTIPNFEREFGVEVRYGTFEGAAELMAKIMTGNSGWDVVFPPSEFIPPLRDLGLLAPLDHKRLSNLDQLAPAFQKPKWDTELGLCVPYMHGATGIVSRRSVDPPISAWSDLWTQRVAGRVTMLDDPAEVLGACLKKLGYSINSTNPVELEKAQKEAIAQKKVLRAYLNAEVRDQLIAGDIVAAQAWAITAQQAIDGAPKNLVWTHPQEGFALFADNAAILRESRRKDVAHEFVNYLLRPKVAAAIALAMNTATANGGAQALLPDEVRNNQTLYPSAETLARGEWIEPVPTAIQKLRDRLWTEIKSA
jgi:spermidine/putrescine transport system substrate-binding protein